MTEGIYLKLVGLDINGISADIVDDKNVKDMNDACDYLLKHHQKIDNNIVWLILPCHYVIKGE